MDNKVQRLLKKPIIQDLDENSFFYFEKTANKLYKSGFKIKFYKGFVDRDKKQKFNGQLDFSNKVLRVGHVYTVDWMQVYVHEYCHFLQFLSDKNYFNKYYDNVHETAKVELDCEKRVVKEIKKYNLPIDVGEYIMSSNAHVCLYYCKPYFNNLITDSAIDKIFHLMPDQFRLNFDKFIKNNYDYLKDVVFHES